MERFKIIDSEGLEVACYKWGQANNNTKGVIQIVHGMTEYALRYDYFAEKLVDQGYIVYAHDHRGHGYTATSKENLGYLADNEGFDWLVEDVKELNNVIKTENEGLPIIIFGHSMGSFVSQRFIELYGNDIDGVILSGTNGKPLLTTKLGILISKVEMMIKGRKAKSKLMDTLSFGNFNSQFKPTRTQYDWLCSDNDEVDKYINSELCGFISTTSFYYDLIRGLWNIHKKENLMMIPKNLPVYIFAGDKDPVGRSGKGIISLYNCYKKLNIIDVTYKLYENGRHEMLNEKNKDEVIGDINNWLEERITIKTCNN